MIYANSYELSILGQINEVLFQLYVIWTLDEFVPTDNIYMIEMSKRLSRTPMCKYLNYTCPIEVLGEEMERLKLSGQ